MKNFEIIGLLNCESLPTDVIKHIALSEDFGIFGCQTVLIGEIAETFPFRDIFNPRTLNSLIIRRGIALIFIRLCSFQWALLGTGNS